MLPSFCAKSSEAISSTTQRFLHQVGLAHCVATHRAQKSHVETEAAMEYMRHKVANMNPDQVINMDQTPIRFSYHKNCTWSKKGQRTIHVHVLSSETKHKTLAATFTMSSHVLVPLLVFKGNQNGLLAKNEISKLPPMCVNGIKKKELIDKSMVMAGIEKCLLPRKDTLPPVVIPLLTFDYSMPT